MLLLYSLLTLRMWYNSKDGRDARNSIRKFHRRLVRFSHSLPDAQFCLNIFPEPVETVIEFWFCFLLSINGDWAVSAFLFNRKAMGMANECRRHKAKSVVFLGISFLLASKTYKFGWTWTSPYRKEGHHMSLHSVGVERSIVERVRGRTGRNTSCTTLTDRRLAGPPAFRGLYNPTCQRGPLWS